MCIVPTFKPGCRYVFNKENCTNDTALINSLGGIYRDAKWLDICHEKEVTPMTLVIGKIIDGPFIYLVHRDWCEEMIPKEL